MPGSFDYAMENAAERAAGRENAEHLGGSPSSEIRERLACCWFPSAYHHGLLDPKIPY